MKYFKAVLSTLILSLVVIAVPQQGLAQWSMGASFEIQDVEPANGFGIQLERELLPSAPIADLGLRAHFSYFSAQNEISSGQVRYSSEVENYDYGVAALGGFSLGLLSPYLGLGLGAANAEFSVDEADLPGEGSESGLYWNGFVGAKVSPIPRIKPYVEYRLTSEEEFENLNSNVDTSSGRLIFGVAVTL